MSSYTHRVLRATVAAAGMAALGMSFIGSAAAATPKTDDVTGGTDSPTATSSPTPGQALDNQSPRTPSLTNGSDTPGVYNDLFTFEVPKVKTAAYATSLPGAAASRHEDADDSDFDWDDEDNDGQDNVCHGLGGSHNLPFHNSIQHPCQSRGNSVHEGDAQYPHRKPA